MFAKSQRAVENMEKWRKLVAKSSGLGIDDDDNDNDEDDDEPALYMQMR